MPPLPVKNPILAEPFTRPLFEICREDGAAPAAEQVTLAGRLSRGDLVASEVLRYAADLAANLAERHRQGTSR